MADRKYMGQVRDLKVKVTGEKGGSKAVELKLELPYMQPGVDGREPIDIGRLTELVNVQVQVWLEPWQWQMSLAGEKDK